MNNTTDPTPTAGAVGSEAGAVTRNAAAETVTICRQEIVKKIKEAREKEKWHRTRSYFDDAEYFAGWAHGLEDLLKVPLRPGRKPKPQNTELSHG